MERYRSANFRYSTAVGGTTGPTLPTVLQNAPKEGAARYTITLSAITDAEFLLTATPIGWTDGLCANLTLNNLGVKTQSGTGNAADCWNR